MRGREVFAYIVAVIAVFAAFLLWMEQGNAKHENELLLAEQATGRCGDKLVVVTSRGTVVAAGNRLESSDEASLYYVKQGETGAEEVWRRGNGSADAMVFRRIKNSQ
jgi:hypothetical protein